MKRAHHDAGGKQGFALLLEAAVAVVVIAVGVLAMISLFSLGTDVRGKAGADNVAAVFADGVLSGLRAAALQAAETPGSNRWESFWETFACGATSIPVAAQSLWSGTAMVIRAGEVCTNVYVNYALHARRETNLVNHALRYRLTVDFPATGGAGRAAAAIEVWPGEFGGDNPEALIFCSEFNNPAEYQ